MLPEEDLIRLRHMFDAARQAQQFLHGRSRGDLETDTQLAFALIQAVQIVGEAARHVSEETRAMLPEVEWRLIVGMRHHLVHAYFDIDYGRLWTTAADDLQRLAEQLGAFLRQLGLQAD